MSLILNTMYIIPDITLRKWAAENDLRAMNTYWGKVGEKKKTVKIY